MTTKKELRSTTLAQLAEQDPVNNRSYDQVINHHLSQHIRNSNHHTIAIYKAIHHEIDLEPCIETLSTHGYHLCAPRFDPKSKSYAFHFFVESTDFEQGRFHIPEPMGVQVNTREIDCILIPGICFGLDGARIGRGAGYYDRLLSGYTGEKIGVCYELQKRTHIPKDTWDQTIDLLCTEAGCFPCK